MKKCGKCLELKDEINFNKNKSKRDGLAFSCKECHSKYRKEYYLINKDSEIEKVKEYQLNKPEKYSKEVRKLNRFSKKGGRTIEVNCDKCGNKVFITKNRTSKNIYCSFECKSLDFKSNYHNYLKQVEKRAIKLNKEFNLTEEFIKDLLENKQSSKCNITNIYIKLNDRNSKTTLQSASLDRIDNNLGYTIGNVQWVCLGINYMKLDYSDNELHTLLKLIKENYTDMV
jgi:endogenous inhibitor of DNA gyrase (YacG/DUF329 family)